MIGILLVTVAGKHPGYLVACSGMMLQDAEAQEYFVPPVYDLNNPDSFYRSEEARISALNHKIRSLETNHPNRRETAAEIAALKEERRTRSLTLQQEIFRHFRMLNVMGLSKDLIGIFQSLRQGLPPGGSGECAAPRLLQYAFSHQLRPLHIAEFWYGTASAGEPHAHGAAYPACMEKCGPVLSFMLDNAYRIPAPRQNREGEPHVVWENENLVVVAKPSGMLSVPGKDPSIPNVEQWLLAKYPMCGSPMLVHRLDMATSGLLVAAKDATTHRRLQALWFTRKVHKTYRAWVAGSVPSSRGILSLPICPNPEDRPRQAIDWQWGKTAVTRYQVIRFTGDATLLELSPLTGRTHQLRLHLSDPRGLGHPILGDTVYGPTDASTTQQASQRLMLHALSIAWHDEKWQRNFRFDDPLKTFE